MHGFNPSRCNSASDLNGCIERNPSKVIIALPTNSKVVQLFEKALTVGFSSINTRLGFDSEVMQPNLLQSDFYKMNIDESFPAYKRQDINPF